MNEPDIEKQIKDLEGLYKKKVIDRAAYYTALDRTRRNYQEWLRRNK
jgi:hypothetical protein